MKHLLKKKKACRLLAIPFSLSGPLYVPCLPCGWLGLYDWVLVSGMCAELMCTTFKTVCKTTCMILHAFSLLLSQADERGRVDSQKPLRVNQNKPPSNRDLPCPQLIQPKKNPLFC